MDFLDDHREVIEKEIYFALCDLLKLDVDIIFYDTTSLHFEIDEEDRADADPPTVKEGADLSNSRYHALRKRGYSKNGRHDAPQLVVGLAVTRDGLPVRHWVFSGNTVDVSTVQQVKDDLRGWRLSRCLFVGDAGMVSANNLKALSQSGGRYIVCMPVTDGGEVAEEVLPRAGRYQEVTENLRVKEVWVGEGERRRRYVVCYNPQEEKRQRRHRQELIAELEAELAGLKATKEHSKRACALRSNRRFKRYLKQLPEGGLVLDQEAIRKAEDRDGKFIVHSNDDSLSAEDMALGYKQLMRVEEAWRTLKSVLKLRPVYHHAEHRIRAHISITLLALLLERVAERACGDTWRNIRDDLNRIKLAQLSSPNGTVWQVTEPRPEAAKRLKSLDIKNPPPVLSLA
jgi:transposase